LGFDINFIIKNFLYGGVGGMPPKKKKIEKKLEE